MKTILIIIMLAMAGVMQAQSFKANYNAATYQAYDSTTFYLEPTAGNHWVIVDYVNLNGSDAVMYIGAALGDGKGAGNMSWAGSTVTPDSIVLNVTANTKKTRNSSGVRTSTCRAYLWFPDGLPSWVAITVKWKSVTTGNLKLYL